MNPQAWRRPFSMVRGIVRAAKGLPAPIELAAGAVLLAIPVPEPITELATDAAGVLLIAHAGRKMARTLPRPPIEPTGGEWREWATGSHPLPIPRGVRTPGRRSIVGGKLRYETG